MKADSATVGGPADGPYFGGGSEPRQVTAEEARSQGGNVDGLTGLATRQVPEPTPIERGPIPSCMQPPGSGDLQGAKGPRQPREFEEGETDHWRRGGKRY